MKQTLKLGKLLSHDEHDLIYKAVGWMVRESWKQGTKRVERWQEENYQAMPRTMIRASQLGLSTYIDIMPTSKSVVIEIDQFFNQDSKLKNFSSRLDEMKGRHIINHGRSGKDLAKFTERMLLQRRRLL